jgi:hypothetical protein
MEDFTSSTNGVEEIVAVTEEELTEGAVTVAEIPAIGIAISEAYKIASRDTRDPFNLSGGTLVNLGNGEAYAVSPTGMTILFDTPQDAQQQLAESYEFEALDDTDLVSLGSELPLPYQALNAAMDEIDALKATTTDVKAGGAVVKDQEGNIVGNTSEIIIHDFSKTVGECIEEIPEKEERSI